MAFDDRLAASRYADAAWFQRMVQHMIAQERVARTAAVTAGQTAQGRYPLRQDHPPPSANVSMEGYYWVLEACAHA